MATATDSINAMRLDLFKVTAGEIFHAAPDTPVTTPSAIDLASLIVLANALAASFNAHVPNVVDATSGAGVHGADSGHRVTAPTAVDLASARSLLSDLEVALQRHADADGAHLAVSFLSSPHVEANGGIFEIRAHANALKTQLNSHYAAAMNSGVAA
jgi:hypothetical protein